MPNSSEVEADQSRECVLEVNRSVSDWVHTSQRRNLEIGDAWSVAFSHVPTAHSRAELSLFAFAPIPIGSLA